MPTLAEPPLTAARCSLDVAITLKTFYPAPRADVFGFIVAEDVLPKILTGFGPLPAVVGTAERTGPWDQPGSSRKVILKDGSTVREAVTDHVTGSYFAYRIWDFGHPIVRALASGATGRWWFDTVEGGTQVVWTYTFTARNRLTRAPLWLLANLLWRGYMQVCLRNSGRFIEQR